MCEMSEERTYYIRTSLMYTDLTREVLFKVYKYLIQSEDITGFLSSLEQQNILRVLFQNNAINRHDYDLVSGHVLNLERFNISLLIRLILNLCKDNIQKPQRGWQTKPHPKDESLGAVLLRLRDVRNKIIGHRADAKLSEAEYEKTWAKIKAILLRVVERVDSKPSENFERRINKYKQINVDTDNARVKRLLDELLSNKKDFDRLQEKVEELSRRSQEFQVYFQTTPERFVRYIKLLFDGGHIVLSGILKKKLGDKDLSEFLEKKKETLTRNIEEKFTSCLFEQESCADHKKWDVFLLASVLLFTFDDDLSQNEIMNIGLIKNARVNYAVLALQSLDADDFMINWTDLIVCLQDLSRNIAEVDKLQVENLIERYKKKDEGGCDAEEYFKQLWESGVEVKTLNDVYNETITELKDSLNMLSQKDITFKQKNVFEFKLLTTCENEEIKKRAENLLENNLQASIQNLDQASDILRGETDKLVAIIAAHPDVTPVEVKQKCIILSFKCSTPGGLVHILDITHGDQFRSTFRNIANELHYIYGYAFLIQGKCTLESVSRVLKMINKTTTNEASSKQISISLECSSLDGISAVLSAIKQEKTTKSLKRIADQMSAMFNETISIKLILDMMEFRNVFEDTDSEGSSSLGSNEFETEELVPVKMDKTDTHADDEKKDVSARQQLYDEKMNEYAIENKEPEENFQTITDTFQTVDTGQDIVWKKGIPMYDCQEEKCHHCIINPISKNSSLTDNHYANCNEKIQVCIACEKNSILNPVTCYCGATLKSVIGSKWGALLIAGDDENPDKAAAMKREILELERVVTSKAPRIIGISKCNVRTVVPVDTKAETRKEETPTWTKIQEHIAYFAKNDDIDTLLIYISCHGGNGGLNEYSETNMFRLGKSSELISLNAFEEQLQTLNKIDKLILFLDRCFPPMVEFKDKQRKFVQINACSEDKKAILKDEGSLFTTYVIQGLKARSEKRECSEDCQHCLSYWDKRTEYISIGSLFDYVNKHLKHKAPPPNRHLKSTWDDIAFFTEDVVYIEFSSKDGKTPICLPLEYLKNINEVKLMLLKAFKVDTETHEVKIEKDIFRNDQEADDECKTLEQVMEAWVNRFPLLVSFSKKKET